MPGGCVYRNIAKAMSASPSSPAVAPREDAAHHAQEKRGIETREQQKNFRTPHWRMEACREAAEWNLTLINDLFHVDSTLDLLFHRAVSASGRSNKNWKYECRGHQPRNEIKGLDVVSIALPQISEQVRSDCGGECPRQHHQSENGSHVPRPKIISGKRRSNTISASIAHHQDERNNAQYSE